MNKLKATLDKIKPIDASSLHATQAVAGIRLASSSAIVGPERTAKYVSTDNTSANICVGLRSVPFSIPLATDTMGTFAGTKLLSRLHTPRIY